MRYEIFLLACLAVPLAAAAACTSARARGVLLSVVIATTALGDAANINFASLEVYRGPDRGFEVGLTDMAAWSLAVGLALRFPGRVAWLPYGSLWLAGFFALAAATAAIGSGLLGAFALFKLARVYAVFWCVANALRAGVSLRWVWRGYLVIAAVITALALWQKYLWGLIRIHGPFDHSNTIPSYLILVIPVVLIWSLCDRGLKASGAVAGLVAVLGMVFANVATLSRAGIALSACAVLAAMAVALVRAPSWRVSAMAVATGLVLLAASLKAADTVVARFYGAPDASAMAREEFNHAAARIAADHPAGIGLNNFAQFLTRHPQYRAHFVAMRYEEQSGVVHNIYLLTAAEMGYAGLALLLVILGRFAWLALRHGLRSHSLEGVLLLGAAIGLGGLYCVSLLEWTLRISPVSYQFAITAGLCVGLAHRLPAPPGRRHRLRRALDLLLYGSPMPRPGVVATA